MVKRFLRFRIFVTQTVMLLILADIVETIQKVIHRISS